MFLKALTGWRMYLLIGAATFAMGMFSGIRWEKGAQFNAAQRALEDLSEKAQSALVTLSESWEKEAAKAQIDLNEWRLQNKADQALLLELLAGQTELRNLFDELDDEVTVVTNFGTCQLSPDAVRLLRAASERARTTDVPID